jgi:hypothetical protein
MVRSDALEMVPVAEQVILNVLVTRTILVIRMSRVALVIQVIDIPGVQAMGEDTKKARSFVVQAMVTATKVAP